NKAVSACARKNGPTAASVGREIRRPVAGKTGTTDKNRSAWFIGFTPNLAGAAFYVDPDAPTTSSVPNSKVPIEVFKKTMIGSLRLLPVRNFVRPTAKMAFGNRGKPRKVTSTTDTLRDGSTVPAGGLIGVVPATWPRTARGHVTTVAAVSPGRKRPGR
ncbi:MAG TPA: hypothetical protein VGR21_11900, partial [Cryptosporangiaceae bacterium]|nr:hypothetical protein [Cryptosporangiaceae bacterium]